MIFPNNSKKIHLIMIGAIAQRFFHTGRTSFASGVSSSLLAKLRKATGYSISNCKEALQKFPEDLQKAEEWLHNEAKKMGWSKWNKIQNRNAAQGLIGVYSEDKLGVMVEVNCETDFVAKNIEFQNLVGHVLLGCCEKGEQFQQRNQETVEKHFLDEAEVMNIKYHSTTIHELVNAAMCKFNEKTVIKRAVILRAAYNSAFGISGLTHPVELCPNLTQASIGKFGALVAYKKLTSDEESKAVCSNICRHIIGMNPQSVGSEDFYNLYNAGKISVEGDGTKITPSEQETILSQENEPDVEDKTPKITLDEDGNEIEEPFKADLKDSDETRLLFQSYLLDPNLHVYDYAWKQAEVVDFERFECGDDVKKAVEEAANSASVRI